MPPCPERMTYLMTILGWCNTSPLRGKLHATAVRMYTKGTHKNIAEIKITLQRKAAKENASINFGFPPYFRKGISRSLATPDPGHRRFWGLCLTNTHYPRSGDPQGWSWHRHFLPRPGLFGFQKNRSSRSSLCHSLQNSHLWHVTTTERREILDRGG